MGAGEIIAIIVSALIICGAAAYIIKAKKSGRKCIGCPDSVSCRGDCHACGCGCKVKSDKDK